MQVGDTVGEYAIEQLLGCGRFGVVFAGRGPEGGRVALKVPRKSRDARELAEAEVQRARECEMDHPDCPLVQMLGVEHVGAFRNILVLEHMDGGTLEEQKPLPWSDAAGMYAMVCEGLQWLHNRGYLHCDLKPENILLHGGLPKICDLGNAQALSSRQQPLTTFYYRSPETLMQLTPYTPGVDSWALGCCLYETVTECTLFDIDACWSSTSEGSSPSEQEEDKDFSPRKHEDSSPEDSSLEDSSQEDSSSSAQEEPQWSSSSSEDESVDEEEETLAHLAQIEAYCGTFPKSTRKAKRQFFNAKGQLFASEPSPPYPSLAAKLAADCPGDDHSGLLDMLGRIFRYKQRPDAGALRKALLSAVK